MLFKLLCTLALGALLQFPCAADDVQIRFIKAPNLPYFASNELFIDAAEYDTFVANIKAPKSGTGRLFWSNTYDPQFNTQKSLWFYIRSGEHDYTFNIPSQNPNWIGYTQGFLVYPEIGPDQSEIREARVIKGDVFANIRSGWQEFWGPRGREVIGLTVNTIQENYIFGKPINYYIYWLLAFIFFIILGKAFFGQISQLKAKPNFLALFMHSGASLFWITIGFWLILELSSSVNYAHRFVDTFRDYVGKTHEQKLALTIGQNFFNFLGFCQKKLPPKARVALIWNEKLYGFLSLWGRYYLYPIQLPENPAPTEETEFILAFQPESDPRLTYRNYALFAKYKENEYILAKKRKI